MGLTVEPVSRVRAHVRALPTSRSKERAAYLGVLVGILLSLPFWVLLALALGFGR